MNPFHTEVGGTYAGQDGVTLTIQAIECRFETGYYWVMYKTPKGKKGEMTMLDFYYWAVRRHDKPHLW